MNKNIIIFSLSGVCLILIGIVIGQLSVSQNSPMSINDSISQKNNIELGTNNPINSLKSTYSPNISSGNIDQKSKILSEYWISSKISEVKKQGYSAWISPDPGGSIIVEKCFPIDYDKTINEKQLRLSECPIIVEGKIIKISKQQIDFQNKNGERSKLDISINGTTQLKILLNGEWEEFKAGNKNTLMQEFEKIPSVKNAKKKWLQSSQ
jgi:hypothetical protein